MVKWADDSSVERIGKNAFQDYPADRLHEVGAPAVAVSVFRASCLAARDLGWEDLRSRWGEHYGVAMITAGAARECGQGIVKWPNDQDISHAMIFVTVGSAKTRSHQKQLSDAAVLLHPPLPV